MNTKSLSIVAAALLVVSQPIFAGHYVSGTQLALWLKADERVKSGAGDRSDSNDSFKAFGYITGVLDGTDRTLCFPEGMNLLQAKLVVTKFLADNPKVLHIDAGSLVIGAMRDAFPCAEK